MKKRWWLLAFALVVVAAILIWPRPARLTDNQPPLANRPMPWNGSAKPVTEGSKPAPTPPARDSSVPKIFKFSRNKADYDKWVQKVRTEMKVSMASMYGAQKAFYSEYDRYTTDIPASGYSPDGEIPFKLGFIRAFNPATKAGESTSVTEGTSRAVLNIDDLDEYLQETQRRYGKEPEPLKFGDSAKGVKLEDAARYCQKECTASETGFEMLVAANLDDDPDLDVWLINEQKQMIHVHDDLAP